MLLVLSLLLYIVPSVMSRKRAEQAKQNSGIAETEFSEEKAEYDENMLFPLSSGEALGLERIKGSNLLITSNSLISFKDILL